MVEGILYTALGMVPLYGLYRCIFIDLGESPLTRLLMGGRLVRWMGIAGAALVDAILGPILILYGLFSIFHVSLSGGMVCGAIVLGLIGITLAMEYRRTFGFHKIERRYESKSMPQIDYKPRDAAASSRDNLRLPR